MEDPMTSDADAPPYVILAELLDSDPANPDLLFDTAQAAYAERNYDAAADLVARHDRAAGATPASRHLAGLIAMARGDWSDAAETFAGLIAGGEDAAAIRFNLGWALAMDGRKAEALAAIDDDVALSNGAAAQLYVGLLHEAGAMNEGLAFARTALGSFPDHRGLNATVSTLAIDAEDLDLARETARRAGDHPDALVTAATLALNADDVTTAARAFEAVLARDPHHPRARIGRGLVALYGDDPAAAADDLDAGAERFGTHLGSWIAAGWAHVLAGDMATAKARFERASAIDDSFGETQGSLAVVSLATGDLDEARRRTEIALRLDRDSFSAALASAMLANAAGDAKTAQRIVALAMRTPVDASGRTIGQAMARLSAKRG